MTEHYYDGEPQCDEDCDCLGFGHDNLAITVLSPMEIEVNGYSGTLMPDGFIARLQSGKGTMPDAAELRLFAEFLLTMAETSERLQNSKE